MGSVPQFRGEFAIVREGELEPVDAGGEPFDMVSCLGKSEPLLPLDVECSPHAVGEVCAAVELR